VDLGIRPQYSHTNSLIAGPYLTKENIENCGGYVSVLGSSSWVTWFSVRFSHSEPTVLIFGENRVENWF
jgi:hypothetical protein